MLSSLADGQWLASKDDSLMNGEVQYWPLFSGWTIVVPLLLYGWRRPALIAAAGMLMVSYTVLSVAQGWH
jgi:hypothetical protein